MTINIVTLGCAKNFVDSEKLMGMLEYLGYNVIFDADTFTDIVIINSCGFIETAKKESLDVIFNFVNAKRQGKVKKILVFGCLSERYKEELRLEVPEVDGFWGVNELEKIIQTFIPLHKKTSFPDITRKLTTPSHYAYLKIAEGCNWNCGFCAIPSIRGKYISTPIDKIVEEGRVLVQKGVKELLVVAQDTTYYGLDLYNRREIAQLLTKLSDIEGLEWIRLHYAYPYQFPKDLIPVIRDNPKVCKYLDIPFQHINTTILQTMNRHVDRKATEDLIHLLRQEIPNIALRTSLIVGLPGETDKAFEELVDFVKSVRFDRLGVFEYSEEENTPAAKNYKDNVPAKEKERRAEYIMKIQRAISLELNEAKVGLQYRTVIDRKEGEYFIGRTEFDSPEIDNEILLSEKNLEIGHFYNVIVSTVDEFDLYGKIV